MIELGAAVEWALEKPCYDLRDDYGRIAFNSTLDVIERYRAWIDGEGKV